MKTLPLFLFSLILACSNSSENSSDASLEYLGVGDAEMFDRSYEISEKTVFEPNISQEQKIIKTGHLRFESRNLDETHRQINRLVSRYQGFVSSDRSGKGYNEDFRSMAIRVPSQHFQAMLDSISRGVAYFDQNEVTQRDVTEEFVDIEARLRAKRELENRYLELLKQAKNVKEMLEIERELSTIREEIEARQGRLNYLQNQVAYSTLNINVYTRTTDRGITTSYGNKMWNAIKSGWNGISLFFLGLLHIWPFFVILLLTVFAVRKYLKRKNKI
jgi:hypothetical protein